MNKQILQDVKAEITIPKVIAFIVLTVAVGVGFYFFRKIKPVAKALDALPGKPV